MYYFVYGLLWMISLLPFAVLYFISDFIFLLVYYIFRYRKNLVLANLALAFPEKTEKERTRIAKKFYRNLIDTNIETIKMLSTRTATINKHFRANWELVNQYCHSGKSIQLHLGHNFNWEWFLDVFPLNIQTKCLIVYRPLSSKIFEKIIYKLRSRSGNILLPTKTMKESFMPHRNSQYMLVLAVDQNPSKINNALWFPFFGKPAPFVPGPAKNAVKKDLVAVFAFIHKIKRGYYELVFSLAEENASVSTEQKLTGKFVTYLEDVTRKYPEMWLWSHRRWRHEWKPEYGPVLQP